MGGSKLAGHRVKWFTDNQNVVRIVRAGSKKLHLQSIALSIFEMCCKHSIHLRSLNEKADYISHIQDFYDWKVNPKCFSTIIYYGALILWIVLLTFIIHSYHFLQLILVPWLSSSGCFYSKLGR